jgi:PHD/YefM family antitoxin component YafN of YafNO toxin-antitoxin module
MVRGLPARRRPVVVTQNGKPAAVVLSPAEFDRLSNHARFVSAVNEGLDDIEKGRVLSHEEVGRLLDERFGALPKAKTKRR